MRKTVHIIKNQKTNKQKKKQNDLDQRHSAAETGARHPNVALSQKKSGKTTRFRTAERARVALKDQCARAQQLAVERKRSCPRRHFLSFFQGWENVNYYCKH